MTKAKILYSDMNDRFSNIVDEETLIKITQYTLDQISSTVGATVGPYGKHILINESTVGHFMTKDGYTVMNHLAFKGEISSIIHSLIQSVSAKLVTEVGDGSSASSIAACKLYNTLLHSDILKMYRPKQIMEALELIKDYTIEYIKSIATPTTLDTLYHIATVSLNNDASAGKLVSSAFEEVGVENPFINVAIDKGEKTYTTKVEGFQVDCGYEDKILINNPDTKECVLENCKVIMFDVGLHDKKFCNILETLTKATYEAKMPLVIIAPNYGKVVRNWFRNFCMANKAANLRLNIISLPNSTRFDKAKYEDLAIKVGATIINTVDNEEDRIDFTAVGHTTQCFDRESGQIVNLNTISNYIGGADKVISNEKITTFIGTQGDVTRIQTRITELKEKLETAKAEDVLTAKYESKKRLAMLTDKLITINVGGITEQSKLADKALFDDAVSACKSALEHGYIEGGNRGVIKGIMQFITQHKLWADDIASGKISASPLIAEDKEFYSKVSMALLESVLEPYNTVLRNANMDKDVYVPEDGNIKKSDLEEFLSRKLNIIKNSNIEVINSAKTDIEITKAITSIIGLLITSELALTKNLNSNVVVD